MQKLNERGIYNLASKITTQLQRWVIERVQQYSILRQYYTVKIPKYAL
jgi:hypothetical protein